MKNLSFNLPLVYSIYFAIQIIRNKSLDLGMNWFTISLYVLNVLIIYLLYKLGKLVENWMEEYHQ